jgi:hypothetical protein
VKSTDIDQMPAVAQEQPEAKQTLEYDPTDPDTWNNYTGPKQCSLEESLPAFAVVHEGSDK